MKNILSIDEAISISNTMRKQKKSIILTGGCFDILHPGHIAFLEKAHMQGDCLFVMLESDKKITRLKGMNRPIHSQAERAQLVSAIRSVDFVILLPVFKENQDYDTLIEQLHPTVIATTKHDPFIEHKNRQSKRIGARVVEVIPYIPHQSTSRVLQILSQEQ